MSDLHPRQAIREWVIATLVAASTAAGARVENTRIIPWKPSDLPALNVYTPHEGNEAETGSAPLEYQRPVEVVIECGVTTSDPAAISGAMDALALQVELALEADLTCGGLASRIVLNGTDLDVASDGKAYVGCATMNYTVTHYREVPVTPAALNDLKTVHTDYDLGGEQAVADRAEDTQTGLDE